MDPIAGWRDLTIRLLLWGCKWGQALIICFLSP
jgi:hypothetical protein